MFSLSIKIKIINKKIDFFDFFNVYFYLFIFNNTFFIFFHFLSFFSFFVYLFLLSLCPSFVKLCFVFFCYNLISFFKQQISFYFFCLKFSFFFLYDQCVEFIKNHLVNFSKKKFLATENAAGR